MEGKKTTKVVPEAGIESPEELKAIIAAQESVIKEQATKVNTLKVQVEEVSKKGKAVSTAPADFELDGKRYPFPAPAFVLNSQRYTAQQALENPDVLRQLVALKAGNIN